MMLWQQIDMYEIHSRSCTTDVAYFQKLAEDERVYKFLLGLNNEFEEVRSSIMSATTLPSQRESLSMVKREEGRKKLRSEPSSQPSRDNSAFVAHGISGLNNK